MSTSPLIRIGLAIAACVAGPLVLSAQSGTLPNQGPGAPRIPSAPSSTPRSNDTSGYWQQRADYTIVATLDETLNGVRAVGTLRYVNHSPDTLREVWVHQHLNAFRPGSRWSATDAREGRQRFQSLSDPNYAYERFTAAPRIDGVAVTPEYPIAPDSSVVRLSLPRPLLPGDSLRVDFSWQARTSTVARRQGRRDRSFDFSQWYPKVAVYDRGGWRPNALVPAGEFYGEFGSFDVTLILPNDQVVGATGVPVSGDPGWARVSADRARAPQLAATAYAGRGAIGAVSTPPAVEVPTGYRAVRFHAANVHHFAWSTSPGFRYEGTTYVRPSTSALRVRGWDSVAVHILYRGDAEQDCASANASARNDTARYAALMRGCVATNRTQWEQGKALDYALSSLKWLESVYGDYPYPQLTILKRIDGGGTEFPMLVENGSASLGLTLHEVGHIYTFGILANNEWQSGWLDEGFTSYQTALQSGDARVPLAMRLAVANDTNPAAPRDATLQRLRVSLDATAGAQALAVRNGTAEPIGTRGDLFAQFNIYNAMVYGRAQSMYQALHDVMGDTPFRTMLRDYYARWQFRHVDRWALQATAERIAGRPLGWFFDQWVGQTGIIDYALRSPVVQKVGSGWVVTVRLSREGQYRHPMPVGVRTAAGWTVVRGNPLSDAETIRIRVAEPPQAVWLDPFGATDSPTSRFYRLPLVAR